MDAPTIWEHALAVLAGLVLPGASAAQHLLKRAEEEHGPTGLETGEKIALYWSNGALMALLAGATLLAWHHAGRTLTELGLTAAPRNLGAGLALGALFLAVYALDTWWQLARPERLSAARERWRRQTPFMPVTRREMRHSLVLVGSAAVGEEIVFRGFLVAHLVRLLGDSPWGLAVAVGLPALVFGAAHAYQGGHAVAKIALLAAVFGAILLVTRSLWIPIAVHLVVDLAGVALSPRLLGADPHPHPDEH